MDQILESLSVVFISPLKDELATLMWCVFLAVVLVFVSTLRQKVTLGKAVKFFMEKGAFTPETALGKAELGKISPSALKSGYRLMEKVSEKGKEDKYYLPEKNHKKAEAVLKATSTPIWLALLEIAAFYFFLVVLYYVLPYLLDGFQNL